MWFDERVMYGGGSGKMLGGWEGWDYLFDLSKEIGWVGVWRLGRWERSLVMFLGDW